MLRRIDFYFDFLSPYSYLACTQLPRFTEQLGVSFNAIPISIIDVMKEVGNTPTTVVCAAKGRYAFADLRRWAVRYGVPINPNPNFTEIDARKLLLGAVAAQEVGEGEAYRKAVFEGVWVNQRAFVDDAEFISDLIAAGVTEAADILARWGDYQNGLNANNQRAVESDIFGVPSFKVDDQLFFGNDRLEFLEDYLKTSEVA